jgi:hypothetical protein
LGAQLEPWTIIEKLDLEKPSFRPSKWPRKLKTAKIVNCQNCQKTVLSELEKVVGHQYPPRSFREFNFWWKREVLEGSEPAYKIVNFSTY